MNGRRYMPPAKRRKIEALVAGEPPMEKEAEGLMVAGPDAEMEVEETEEIQSGPSSGLMASAEMLGGAKVGDTVSFKVVSIDPKTGEGSLEAVTGEMET